MNHDIDDLLAIIKELERRVIELELREIRRMNSAPVEDAWYWEHG